VEIGHRKAMKEGNGETVMRRGERGDRTEVPEGVWG